MSELNKGNNDQKSLKQNEEPIKINKPIDRSELKLEDSLKDIDDMLSNPEKLKDGYNILSNHETQRNFYLNFLKISFDTT